MKKPFSRLSRELAFHCNYFDIQHDRYVLPSGDEGNYFFLDHAPSIYVVPILDDGRVVMTKQFRYVLGRDSVEFPGGAVNEGETVEQAAVRELVEEVGMKAESLEKIGVFAPYNGVANELCSVFAAKGLTEVKKPGTPDEPIELVLVDDATFDAISQSGQMFDGMTLAAWYYYHQSIRS